MQLFSSTYQTGRVVLHSTTPDILGADVPAGSVLENDTGYTPTDYVRALLKTPPTYGSGFRLYVDGSFYYLPDGTHTSDAFDYYLIINGVIDSFATVTLIDGTAVTSMANSSLESIARIQKNTSAPIETMSAASSISLCRVESLSTAQDAYGAIVEALGAGLAARGAGIEHMAAASTTIGASIEVLTAISNNRLAIMEQLAGLTTQVAAQYETRQGLTQISNARAAMIETLQGVAVAQGAPLESVNGLIPIARSLSAAIESLKGVSVTQAAPFAVLAGLARNNAGQIETIAQLIVSGPEAFETLIRTSRGLMASTESLQQLQALSSVPLEALGAGIALTYDDLEMMLTGETDLEMGLTDFMDIN